jgi:hypothetical protein
MNSPYPQPGDSAARIDRPETTVADLSLRQLRTVRSIDRHGSLSAAAKALNRTQPAVSKALCALERQLGSISSRAPRAGSPRTRHCEPKISSKTSWPSSAARTIRWPRDNA